MCHQSNEFVDIDKLMLTCKIYAQAIYELSKYLWSVLSRFEFSIKIRKSKMASNCNFLYTRKVSLS